MRKTVSGIKEIAKRAGVHPSTVSRVLNPQTRTLVSAQVAAKILNIAESVAYRRNSMAVGHCVVPFSVRAMRSFARYTLVVTRS